MYGPPSHPHAKRLMILGAGELGKEVILEAQRLGVETIAVDRYANAPAMQVAHRAYIVDMRDADALRNVIENEQPHLIVPEIEAIATEMLLDLEARGFTVIPNARATNLTMDREGIRRLAAEQLHLPTANYQFADTRAELEQAIAKVGLPCVVKPVMSSSGKGQSVCRTLADVDKVWETAQTAGRVQGQRVIVEAFIQFESEITVLTVRSVNGTHFCPAIGHRQENGDYIESWQPHPLTAVQWEKSKEIARTITDELGGYGLFGVELFITADTVYFSEISPRPHDTGMVTMATQAQSEFALHVRAILGLPIPEITLLGPGASHAIKSPIASNNYQVDGLAAALTIPGTDVRLFGKPEATVGRRLAVVLSRAATPDAAREHAASAASEIRIVPSV
ncbi:formate-dependent phosphoribosylglycinamide formyltransferase [Alicyclobacillus fodiniaquatilis]|uniref:Formate-dependent phosphoribosylglycinamide formyltransferase n=1 Tax=Alicyclobacillus fodiniaquatilis TaxID=1661150 RepID=A0ABW4JDM2_9BACL